MRSAHKAVCAAADGSMLAVPGETFLQLSELPDDPIGIFTGNLLYFKEQLQTKYGYPVSGSWQAFS